MITVRVPPGPASTFTDAPPAIIAALPGSIADPVNAAVPERIEARYRGSR